jgi:hypothetical protein
MKWLIRFMIEICIFYNDAKFSWIVGAACTENELKTYLRMLMWWYTFYNHAKCSWILDAACTESELKTYLILLMLVFWAVLLCRLVGRHKCFRGMYCLHFSPEDMFLWVHICLRAHTALQPRRTSLTSLLP